MIRQRNEAQSQAALTNHPADWNIFKGLRNQVTSRLRVEKLNWQKKKLHDCSNDPSRQWQNTLSWFNWKSVSTPTQLYYQGKLFNKPVDIANCQNEFFVNKIKTIRANIPPQTADLLDKLKSLMKDRKSIFSLKCAHPDTIEKILFSLKNSKSFGLDNIDTFSLKLGAKYIIPVVTHIIDKPLV